MQYASFLLVSILAFTACSSPGDSVGADTSSPDLVASSDIPPDLSDSPCLTGPKCISDDDCGSGARCNTAFDPPACIELYCLGDGYPCTLDEYCEGQKCTHNTPYSKVCRSGTGFPLEGWPCGFHHNEYYGSSCEGELICNGQECTQPNTGVEGDECTKPEHCRTDLRCDGQKCIKPLSAARHDRCDGHDHCISQLVCAPQWKNCVLPNDYAAPCTSDSDCNGGLECVQVPADESDTLFCSPSGPMGCSYGSQGDPCCNHADCSSGLCEGFDESVPRSGHCAANSN